MQISLKWIQELVDLQTVNLEDFINKLTLGGFEVEEILEVKIANMKTTALDISATANRADSLSIQGISSEIASLLNQVPKSSNYLIEQQSWEKVLDNLYSTNINETQTDCLGFISLTIENVNDFSSPKWLQQKLLASGVTPKNNLMDFQDYVTLESGYPLEFYDFQKIKSNLGSSKFQFHLKNSKNFNSFKAINNEEYKLDNSILMITANDLPISIAGIISSKSTICSNITNSLIIEGSVFNAAKIRQESRILGLRTERSSRYEKSLKAINLFESIYRFISLLRIANSDLICKLHTFEQPLIDPIQIIHLSYDKIKQVLGPIKQTSKNEYKYISPEIITNLLKRLQFKVKYTNHEWEVIIPPLRTNDIIQEIDVIEEIGRIYGFNNFLTRLPEVKQIGSEDYDYQTRKKLTSCLSNLGLNELIQYSLVNNEYYLKDDISLINPLSKDYSNLRSSLLPNLLRANEENLKKGNLILEGFEYGHVFLANSSGIVKEIEHIAGIFGGIKIKLDWSKKSRLINWFEAKGKIDLLFQKLNIKIYWKSYTPIKEKHILHPYSTAQILSRDNTKLGIFGQVSPLLAKKLNISSVTYLFELNFELIKTLILQNRLVSYQEYSLYPKIIKDLSFIIKENISFTKIREIIYLNGSEFLTEIHLKDEYHGNSIPENYVSLCLELIFHSNSETLQNKKVERIINNIRNVLNKTFNVIMRD